MTARISFPGNGWPRLQGSRPGFTLIELLVSLAIVGVVGLAVGAAVFSGIAVWERTASFDASRVGAVFCLERMAFDLRNAVPFHGIGFEGDSRTCRFPVPSRSGIGATNSAFPPFLEVEYVYDRDKETLARRTRSFPFSELDSRADVETVLTGVKKLTLSYGAANREGGTRGMSWRGSWMEDARQWAAVRIAMELWDGDAGIEMRRTIYIESRTDEIEGGRRPPAGAGIWNQ